MRLFDSHCHLDFIAFSADRQDVIQRAYDAHVRAIFVPGVSRQQSSHSAWLDDCQLIDIYRGFGLHPYFIEQHQSLDLQWLEQQLVANPQAVVGEIGIDMTCAEGNKQHDLFCRQVELACRYHRSIVLHHRKSQPELLRVIKSCHAQLPEVAGVIHAFSGSFEQAQEWLRLGFMLGVGGTITYERARRTRQALSDSSLESLVLETDAPDMPICGYQGQRNEPAMVNHINQSLADLHRRSVADVAEITWQNAQRLFSRR